MAKRRGVERYRAYLRRGAPGPHSYAVLLGLDALDPAAMLRVAETGIPYGAFDQFRENTSFSIDDTIACVGIPRRTLSRRKIEGRLAPDESDRLLRAARLFARALDVFEGDREAAADWLTRAQPGLGGSVPLDLARTDVGAREVERVLGRLDHGVFS